MGVQGRLFRMQALCAMVLGGCAALLSGCATPPGQTVDRIDARVLSAQSDNAFTSIQAAIDAAPDGQPWTIFIGPGVFEERVIINKPDIRLVGSGKRNTTIAYARYAGEPVAPGSEETWGTFRTAVVEVLAPDVSLFDLTIENPSNLLWVSKTRA